MCSEPYLSLRIPWMHVGEGLHFPCLRRVTASRKARRPLRRSMLSPKEETNPEAASAPDPGTGPARRHAWRCIRAEREYYGGG
jgi:hypothetical protein